MRPNVQYQHGAGRQKRKENAASAVYPKRPDIFLFWFKFFRMERRMEKIFCKKTELFLRFSLQRFC